jgi:hypothetical protein
MGVQKKTRKFATVKRVIGQRDARLKKNILKNESEPQKKEEEQLVRNVQVSQGKIAGSSWLMVSSEQSTSAEQHVLPAQHCTPGSLQRSGGYQFPFAHCPPQAATSTDADGHAVRHLHPDHHVLCHG